jgi:beta-lactamase class A
LKCICFIATAAVLQIAVARSEQRAAATDDFLWKKLDARVNETVEKFDGEMGVAIVDLTDGRAILKNPDHVFPTASSIKIAILLELYHQEQEARGGAQGKAKLDDVYIFDPKDLVEDSQIMAGLTAGVTRVTNRDLAQFMIAVSDNAATNVLIDRVGKDNVNAMLRNFGLTKTMLRRKMMDIAAAKRGDENVSTPQEMSRLLEAIYKGQSVEQGTHRSVRQAVIDFEGKLHSMRTADWGSSSEQTGKLGRCADRFRNNFREEPSVHDQRDDSL